MKALAMVRGLFKATGTEIETLPPIKLYRLEATDRQIADAVDAADEELDRGERIVSLLEQIKGILMEHHSVGFCAKMANWEYKVCPHCSAPTNIFDDIDAEISKRKGGA